jgi:hypothetical protein
MRYFTDGLNDQTTHKKKEAELNVLNLSLLLHHLSSYKTIFFPICQETKQAKQN